jgi:phytoene desaturase
MKTAIVIWSGVSGLASACYLAKDGYKVQLYEKNSYFGWRAGVWKRDGFTFDTGPSWYLMPEVFEDFFAHFWKQSLDYYETHKLDPAYRVYFWEKDFCDISTNFKDNRDLFESLEVWAGERLERYVSTAKSEYRDVIGTLIYKNYDKIRDFFTWKWMKFILRRKNYGSYESYVKKYFSSPKLQKILLYTSVFLWGSPKNTPALYSLINHCDFNDGVYFPKWGIRSVVDAFVELARDLWVELYINAPVEKILIEHSRVEWVRVNSQEIFADLVVSSWDYHYTDAYLIETKYRQYSQKKWDSMVLSPSGFIIYLWINKKLAGLRHHTLVFDPDWDQHFDSIFIDKKLSERPSYYVSCVSKSDPSVAPDGYEWLFVFVPTATGLSLSECRKQQYADKIIDHLSWQIGEDITPHIILKKIYTGDDFHKDFFAFQGNALWLAHTFTQTLIFRPENKHPKVSWLYFTGHYTTPWTGIPMVLISAKLMCDKILASKNA